MFTVEQLEQLKRGLEENYDWADGNIWEIPIDLPDNINLAITAIEELIEVRKNV